MKKWILAGSCLSVVLFSGCEQSKTQSGDPSIAVYIQKADSMADSSASTASGSGSGISSMGISIMNYSVMEMTGPDGEGWVTSEAGIKFRFYDQYDNLITSDTAIGTMIEGVKRGAKWNVLFNVTSSPESFDFSGTLIPKTIGNCDDGYDIESAIVTGSNSSTGVQLNLTYSNIVYETGSTIKAISGTIIGTINKAGETWNISVTYKSDGTANGSITGPNDYSATVHLNADGSGYYEDGEGRHDIPILA